jgi:peptide-methionine (R)-S-oxide reductase
MKIITGIILTVVLLISCNEVYKSSSGVNMSDKKIAEKLVPDSTGKVNLTDEEWRSMLTDEQYQITRQCGTEPPFTGKYNKHYEAGIYFCSSCGNELFTSATKYDSGSGWPSFSKPLNNENISTKIDTTYGMNRMEIKCGRCGSHLGHVFEDGPLPTGLRYCVNSASLKFEAEKE